MAFHIFRTDDSKIISAIAAGGRERLKYENKLYEKYFYFIREGVKKYQLEEDESATAYSDTIIAVINQIINQRYEKQAELKTYLYQIFSNRCVSYIRKKTSNKAASTYDTHLLSEILSPMTDHTQNIIQAIIEREAEQNLLDRLRQIGEKCKELLLLWAEGTPDAEIMQHLAYNSVDVVKVSRMRCMNKLKDIYHTQNQIGI